MNYALFLGCTIPARSRNYELSARQVAKALGIHLVDLNDFICCGLPIKWADQRSSQVMAAYNLCLARSQNLDICTLCSSCALELNEVAHQLSEGSPERDMVNQQLSKVGLHYENPVKIRHFARVLYEEIDPQRIITRVERDLSGLKIAFHYGCHYLRDPYVDTQPDHRTSIEALITITGAQVVHYPWEDQCCGGPVLPVDEKSALSVAKEKLDVLAESEADALCVVCPFCAVMYDSNQKGIETEFGCLYQLPVLYVTQILGLAFGYDRKALGLNMNVVKTKALLSKIDG